MGILHYDLCTCIIISHWILLKMRNDSDKSCWEKSEDIFYVPITFFRKLCHLCNNMLKRQRTRQATDDNIIQCMCIVYCITRATDTHSEYVAFTALLWQQWLRKPPSMLCLYIHCLSCYTYNLSTLELFPFSSSNSKLTENAPSSRCQKCPSLQPVLWNMAWMPATL